jgi:O-antigen ligase
MASPSSLALRPPSGGRTQPAKGRIVAPSRPPTTLLEKLGIFSLSLFLFLLFGRPADFFLPYFHLPMTASVTAMLIAVLTGGIAHVFRSPLGLSMTLLTAWFILAIPFSSHRGGSFEVISSTWMRSYLCFVLIVALCTRPLQIRRITHILAWSLLITSLLGLAFGVAPHGRLQLPVGLLTGPNELGGAMIVGIVYWFFIFFDPFCSGIYRAFSLVAVLPMMLVLLKTGSRGGLLSLSVVLVVMFFRLPAAKKLIVTCGAIIFLILAFVTLPEDLRRRFTTYFRSDDSPVTQDLDSPTESAESRLYLLQRGVEFTLTHPIFGVGPDQFATYEDKTARGEGKGKGIWLGCHNTYVQISSEAGIPALMIFLFMLFAAWRSTTSIQRRAKQLATPYGLALENTAVALRMVLIAHMVFFVFEHSAYMPFWPALLGMIAALRNGFETELGLLEKTAAPAPARPVAPKRFPLPVRA